MERALAIALLSMLLVTALAGSVFINLASANFSTLEDLFWSLWKPSKIPPPQISFSGNKVTYNTASVSLQYCINTSTKIPFVQDGKITKVNCWLDGTPWEQFSRYRCMRANQTSPLNLTRLTNGKHSVKVEATAYYTYRARTCGHSTIAGAITIAGSSTVSFTVDTIPPHLQVLVNQIRTYNTTSVPLYFTVDEFVSWIGYSLDGHAYVTIMGNTTLADLSYGSHTLTVSATDPAGNTAASETLHFSISEPSPTIEPFPTTWVAAAAVSVVVAIAGLVFYLRKRRHSQSKTLNC